MKLNSTHFFLMLMIPLILLGFWKSYFSILGNLPPTFTVTLQIHTGLMLLWVAILIAQPWLMRIGRIQIHRIIGRSTYVIAPLLVWFGLKAIHEVSLRPPDEITQLDADNLVLGLGQLLAFSVTWGLAIAYRKKRELHARFMISTAFSIATGAIFRIFLVWIPGFKTMSLAAHGNFITLNAILLALIVLDWRAGMKWSPFFVVFGILSIVYLWYFTIADTDIWLTFTAWFDSLHI